MNPNKYWNWTSEYFISKYYWEGINFPSENDDVSRKIPIAFHNEWSYDYHFITKRLAEELKKKTISLFRKKHWKIYSLYSSNRKRSYKNWQKLRKVAENMSYILQFIDKGLWQGYAQGLWQANYQILWIIFAKELVKLNINMDAMIKNVKV